MNIAYRIGHHLFLLTLWTLVTSGAVLAGEPTTVTAPDRPLFLVVLQPPAPGQARFDVTKHGGTVEFDGGHRLAIRLPEAALEGLLHNPQVRYVQRVVRADAAASPASAPTAPSTKGLALTADSVTPATVETNGNGSWTSGPYSYDASGNIAAVGPSSDVTTDSFQYDAFGRLGAASLYDGSATRTESYEYDRYGNRTAKTTNGTRVAIATDPATNRLAASTSAIYDSVGNVTYHSAIGAIQYDGASMPRQLDNSSPGPTLYIYDANDERVATVHNYSTVMVNWDWTVRDLNGSVVREWESFGPTGSEYMLWTNDYITDAGQLLAANREPAEGGIRHFHVDYLGTPKMVTNEAGERISWHVYYPFGIEATSIHQEAAHGYSGEVSRRYTSHERDFNGGTSTENTKYLDYMHARYYNPNWGRFLSVDPVIDFKLSLPHPQGWNRYAYVRNNPINAVDRDGRCEICLDNALGREQLAVARGEMSMAEYNQRNAARATGAAVGGVVGFGFLAATAGGGGGLAAGAFDLAPIARGNYIESALARAFGGGLPRTFPVIDRFLAGVATSVKSIDLLGKSYQSATRLTSVISGYADKLSQFSGGAMGQTVVNGADVTKKVLEVVIQRGVATPEQMAAIQKAAEYAKTIDVTVKLIQVK